MPEQYEISVYGKKYDITWNRPDPPSTADFKRIVGGIKTSLDDEARKGMAEGRIASSQRLKAQYPEQAKQARAKAYREMEPPKKEFNYRRMISESPVTLMGAEGLPLSPLTNPAEGSRLQKEAETGKGIKGFAARTAYGALEPQSQVLGAVAPLLPVRLLGALGIGAGAMKVKAGAERFREDPVGGALDIATGGLVGVGGGRMAYKGKPKAPPAETPAVQTKAPPVDPVAKVTELIKQAKPSRKETKELYHEERSKRAAAVGLALKKGKGEKAFSTAKQELEGELPFAEFKPIRNKLTKKDQTTLFEKIRTHEPWNVVGEYNKVNTADALKRILDPKHPKSPRDYEIELLEEVFGPEFVKPFKGRDVGSELMGILNFPKAAIASADRSAVLRQSLIYSVAHPVKAVKMAYKAEKAAWAKPEMNRTYFSKTKNETAFESQAYQNLMNEIRADPHYKLAHDSGLALPGTSMKRAKLEDREEAFMSSIAEALPHVKNAERAYSSYLNQMRFDRFKDYASEAIKAGYDPQKQPEEFAKIAHTVNILTGRGSLGPKFNQAAPFLNMLMFSPRFVASRLQVFNPRIYTSLPKGARKAAVKDMARFGAVMVTTTYLLAKNGVDIETDARSSDFGKIRQGNTRIDPWGGYQQWVVLSMRMATGQVKHSSTDEVEEGNARKVASEFGWYKASPGLQTGMSALSGKNVIGQEIDRKMLPLELITPLVLKDYYEVLKENGPSGVALGLPAFFGVSTQVHKK